MQYKIEWYYIEGNETKIELQIISDRKPKYLLMCRKDKNSTMETLFSDNLENLKRIAEKSLNYNLYKLKYRKNKRAITTRIEF